MLGNSLVGWARYGGKLDSIISIECTSRSQAGMKIMNTVL